MRSIKNIVILIYSLKGGGAEKVAASLSKILNKKYNVYLIVFDSRDIVYSYSGNLIDLNIKSETNIFKKIINVFLRIHKVKKIKKLYKINTTVSFLETSNIINIFSRVNDKIIISIRSHISSKRKNFYKYFISSIIKFFYKKADQIIAVSKGVAEDLIQNYNLPSAKVKYIYNSVDIDKIKNMAKEPIENHTDLYEDKFTLINIGRLNTAKGQWHLIRSLKAIKADIPNIKLIILGQGELEPYLKRITDRMNLNDNVVFCGFKKNPYKYIDKADLFVFSSLYEGFSNALLEAMVCSIPIISTDCNSGPREVLAPDTNINNKCIDIEYSKYGIMFPVFDGIKYDEEDPLTKEEKLLAESVIQLYKNEKLRNEYSHKSDERICDFSVNKIEDEWLKLIED
ncbi:glycosyltransferase [Senegalia sp. (in: firmicutes)]|uniref:glycosyltransferase n=1 Tax=Senegalia sp. (in: firmicutes) TaxID=1924098 RepID=UPI003F981862